jgi:hypothetical protein
MNIKIIEKNLKIIKLIFLLKIFLQKNLHHITK